MNFFFSYWNTFTIFNSSQLAKMKKGIPDMSLPYRDEAVGLKSCKYT